MQIQKDSNLQFFVGQNVDVLDRVNKWLNGQVLAIQNDRIYVHYTGWNPKFDQFVDVNSRRILKQWQHKNDVTLNNRIDVYHPVGGWLQARVVQIGKPNQNELIQNVKVHFFNYHPKYDMWVNLKDKNQVAIIGQKSKGYGVGKRKRKVNKQRLLSQFYRGNQQYIIEILRKKLVKMISQLNENNLVIKQIGGDGNCLFRSISDQLYGQETFHSQIRQLCMRYISGQKQFFQNFLVQDIEEYIERKSKDGVWGDDIQIQALSQIYSRPIQIYAMSNKPIRTFHQDNEHNIEPLRLAYIGNCHYNSIKRKSQQDSGLIGSGFGQFEVHFMDSYLQHKNSQLYWINRNRDKFSNYNPLQLTFQQRIEAQTTQRSRFEQCEQDLMQQVIQVSENQQISNEIQAAELRQLQKVSEQEAIQKQLRRLQEQQLDQAKKMSAVNTQLLSHKQKPYWFGDLQSMGFTQQQIWFAIQIKGYDPEGVQNFLLDSM